MSDPNSRVAESAAANERRRAREPVIVDWDERLARLYDMLDDVYDDQP